MLSRFLWRQPLASAVEVETVPEQTALVAQDQTLRDPTTHSWQTQSFSRRRGNSQCCPEDDELSECIDTTTITKHTTHTNAKGESIEETIVTQTHHTHLHGHAHHDHHHHPHSHHPNLHAPLQSPEIISPEPSHCQASRTGSGSSFESATTSGQPVPFFSHHHPSHGHTHSHNFVVDDDYLFNTKALDKSPHTLDKPQNGNGSKLSHAPLPLATGRSYGLPKAYSHTNYNTPTALNYPEGMTVNDIPMKTFHVSNGNDGSNIRTGHTIAIDGEEPCDAAHIPHMHMMGMSTTSSSSVTLSMSRDKEAGKEHVSITFSSQNQETIHFGPCLVTASDVPTWQRNPYISSAYRTGYSAKLCAWSLIQWHNETCNVWTHLIGMFIFLLLGIYRFETDLADAPLAQQLSFLFFYSMVAICMLLSATYHLFACMGEGWHDALYRMDMTGICLMVLGSYIPGIVISFHCYPFLAKIYASVITILISGIILCQNIEACLHPRWFTVRILATLSSVVFAILPCTHFYLVSPQSHTQILVPVIYLTITLYAVGFCFWATKFPERYWPGKFDYIFNSHNIWHTFVVLAPLAWDSGLMNVVRMMITGQWQCPMIPYG